MKTQISSLFFGFILSAQSTLAHAGLSQTEILAHKTALAQFEHGKIRTSLRLAKAEQHLALVKAEYQKLRTVELLQEQESLSKAIESLRQEMGFIVRSIAEVRAHLLEA